MDTKLDEPTEIEPDEAIENDDALIYTFEGDAYRIEKGEIELESDEDGIVFVTYQGLFYAPFDPDGWVILSGDEPEIVTDICSSKDVRFADADYEGYPITMEVGYRTDDNITRSLWQNDKVRPKEIESLINKDITEVRLSVEIDGSGHITVTDVSVWPDNPNVTFDI